MKNTLYLNDHMKNVKIWLKPSNLENIHCSTIDLVLLVLYFNNLKVNLL